jgi:stearoyl-CoA 9-desaturase NADPH oxidoreductase
MTARSVAPLSRVAAVADRRGLRQALWGAAGWLSTPLLPDDYVGLVNPLWSRGQLRGRVEAVVPETRDAASIVIRPGCGWRGHLAGQHVGVGVDVDGVRRWRTYSVSSAPDRSDGCITITVKAVPGGVVSPYLVHRVAPGAIVGLGRAEGEFVLPRTLPARLLFLTGGSGITPVMAMLASLAARPDPPDVVLLHSAPTVGDVIFEAELQRLARRAVWLRLRVHHTRHARGGSEHVTMSRLPEFCPDWAERETWACGPSAMLEDIERQWRAAGIPERLRLERFRPIRTTADRAGGAGGRVRFSRTHRTVHADADTPLLEVGENAGVLMPGGCRMGICFTCVCRIKSGQVRDLRTGREHGEPGQLIQTCVSAAAGPLEIDL